MIKHSRQQAKALGLSRCYGIVCLKHVALEGERYVSGACIGCAKELIRKIRAENPEKTRAHRLKSQAKTAEKRRVDPVARAKKLAADATYRANNPKLVADIKRRWYAEHPGRSTALATKRKVAVKQRTPKWLTPDDWFIVKEAYELAALRTKMLGFPWEVDHIIPLQGDTVSGLHVPHNLQVIPRKLNRAKWNLYEVT